MNKVSEKFVGGGFSLALLLISVVAAASYLSIQRLTAQKQWVVHTQQVTESIARVRIHLGNAESAQNSYIFTENRLYRETYKQQKQKVYQLLKDMRRLSSNNPNQQNRLDTLEPLVAEKFSLLEQSIDLFKEKSLDKATQRSIVDRGVEIGKQMQAISQAIENEEKTLLQGETSATEDLFQEIVIIVSLGYIAILNHS
ncbi:CHASE3 domain-containing protein [Nostoc punctiforme FACHB-252]|uniref:CHASE3 domain-containing protein n=1 Tax=Nostoc punctiforme FACHB-252 TaxID=1357509 RepID=A0ABR8HNC1_NOSPU|nr:CHASE3 domain-containing protein [Nostoc punctiforme]MBD2616540.1 CHASE3 domain-containing protein [Nostoc punctiforme FACHB-252]